MKLLTAKYSGKEFIGVYLPEENVVLNLTLAAAESGMSLPETMMEAVALGPEFLEAAEKLIVSVKETLLFTYGMEDPDLELLAPIPRPSKNVFCVGKNYKDHVIEMGSASDLPTHVMVFSKAPTTVIGHKEGIPRHEEVTDELDYEGELAIVIGKKGKGITQESALDHVFGFTILNDVTARDLQREHKQFLIGKSLDSSCPMGPFLVPKEYLDVKKGFSITTKVNGELRQNSHTDAFIFSIPVIIEALSRGMTLEPGDIIATGTPAGVGKGFKPPKLLKKGDKIEITIEGIGTLANEII